MPGPASHSETHAGPRHFTSSASMPDPSASPCLAVARVTQALGGQDSRDVLVLAVTVPLDLPIVLPKHALCDHHSHPRLRLQLGGCG